jgi:hypothetical protein
MFLAAREGYSNISHGDVTNLQAMPNSVAFHYGVLPGMSAGLSGIRSNNVRIWLLGGHTRMISARQTTAEMPPDASNRNVTSQAASRTGERGGRDGSAASRSMAVRTGAGGAAGSAPDGAGGTAAGASAGGGASGSASRTGFHSAPQVEHRTERPGFMREAGTSYVAEQPGQAICMETRYDAARIITGMHPDVAKEFCRSTRNGEMRRHRVNRADAEIRNGRTALRP